MTKRKWRHPTPEEFENLSDWCFDYELPDGGRTVIRGDGRAFARKMLAELLPTWERIWTYGTEDGTQAVVRGTFPNEREIVERFNLPDLQRELSAKHFALVKALYEALKEQARVASYAVGVARVELGTAQKRSDGGKNRAVERKRIAAEREKILEDAAKKLRKSNRRLTDSDIARHLSDRSEEKYGKFGTILKKLPRLLRK